MPFSALASEKSAYVNEEYGFTLRHPSSLMLKSFGEAYFDLLKGEKILLRASIEDDTFKIFIQEIKAETDVFLSFARERCKTICDADGPDGSTYCKKVETEREWRSVNGIRVLEFTLIFTRENYQDKTKEESRMGPVYMIDISRQNRPLALMIHPMPGTLESRDTWQLTRELIETISLLR